MHRLLSFSLVFGYAAAAGFMGSSDEKESRSIDPPELLRSNSTPGTPRFIKRIMANPTTRSRSVTVTDSVVQVALLGGNPEEALGLLKSDAPANLYECNALGKDFFAMAYEYRFSHPELLRAAILHPEFQVNRLRQDGQSLLHFLIQNQDIEMIRILFENYRDTVDTNILGSTGILPLGIALDHAQVFEMLLKEAPGLNVMTKDAYGISCFFEAINMDKWHLVRQMLDRPEVTQERIANRNIPTVLSPEIFKNK